MWNPENYDDRAIGPIGLADAYLLSAICRYLQPRIAIEYGGLLGHSLAVMAEHCGFVISVDDNAGVALREMAKKVSNARVVQSDMSFYEPADSVESIVDLVLIDAAHLYDDNVAAYENVLPVLSSDAVILVHDTGDWKTDDLPPQWAAWVEHRAMFLEHDRKFVRYLREKGYSDVTFGTARHLRHGITVLQRRTW